MSRLRLAKIAAPSAPPATTAELFYSLPDLKLEAIDENGKIAVLGGFATSDYRLIRVLVVTASGTYTPTAGVRALYVECVGGGGAGGGALVASSNLSCGSGGGSGAYSAVFLTGAQIKSSYTVQVGAGGTGVSGAAGNAGTDTTFDSPAVCVAKAGAGGFSMAAGTSAGFNSGNAGGAASGGTGDLKLDGSSGNPGVRLSATAGMGGYGGASVLGGAGVAQVGTGGGGAGGNFGGGGGGAATTGAVQTGGNGASGVIRVWEFA